MTDGAPREPGGDAPPIEPPTDHEDPVEDVRETVDDGGLYGVP